MMHFDGLFNHHDAAKEPPRPPLESVPKGDANIVEVLDVLQDIILYDEVDMPADAVKKSANGEDHTPDGSEREMMWNFFAMHLMDRFEEEKEKNPYLNAIDCAASFINDELKMDTLDKALGAHLLAALRTLAESTGESRTIH